MILIFYPFERSIDTPVALLSWGTIVPTFTKFYFDMPFVKELEVRKNGRKTDNQTGNPGNAAF